MCNIHTAIFVRSGIGDKKNEEGGLEARYCGPAYRIGSELCRREIIPSFVLHAPDRPAEEMALRIVRGAVCVPTYKAMKLLSSVVSSGAPFDEDDLLDLALKGVSLEEVFLRGRAPENMQVAMAAWAKRLADGLSLFFSQHPGEKTLVVSHPVILEYTIATWLHPQPLSRVFSPAETAIATFEDGSLVRLEFHSNLGAPEKKREPEMGGSSPKVY